MDASWKPAFRRGALAVWLLGLAVVLALNGWRAEITTPRALLAAAVLMGSFGVFAVLLLNSARTRRLVIRSEEAFSQQRTWWTVAALAFFFLALVCSFQLSKAIRWFA